MTERRKIVFLPGLLCDASVFAAQITSLSAHADIRVADFSKQDSIEAMADEALSHFDGKVTLIGFSMGGRVALEAIRRAPDRVEALCLMDTGAAPAREGEAAPRRALVELARRHGMKALAAQWLPPMLHIEREADPILLEPLMAMVERGSVEQHERQIPADSKSAGRAICSQGFASNRAPWKK